jgi:hypothetical protein
VAASGASGRVGRWCPTETRCARGTISPPVAFGDSLPTKGRDHSSGVTPRFSATARTRDYYRIEDEEGRRYWVFREGLYEDGAGMLPAWYLHGVFG